MDETCQSAIGPAPNRTIAGTRSPVSRWRPSRGAATAARLVAKGYLRATDHTILVRDSGAPVADVRDGRGRELLSDYVFTARRQHPEELTHRDRLRTHLDTQATRIATLEAENERLQGVIESYDPRVRKAVETWMRGCNGFVPGNPKIAAAGVMRAFRALDDHPLKRTETTHAD